MSELFPLFLFAFSALLTPGPNNLLILNSGLNFGTKRSLPHFVGICTGFPMMIVVVALGFGAVIAKNEWLNIFFQIAGSLYILYLAWRLVSSNVSPDTSRKVLKPMTYLQAVLFQWVNPKAWMTAVGITSLFTLTENYLSNAFIIGGTVSLTTFFCTGTWLVFGIYLKNFLTDPQYLRWFNLSMAACLVASIALIFI